MRAFILLSLPVVFMVSCGGEESSPAAPSLTLDAPSVEHSTATFLDLENNQAGEMDDSGPTWVGDAVGMVPPPPPSCVSISNLTLNSVTWTFTNCTGPHGWTWNGQMTISWQKNPDGSRLVRHERRNMVGTKSGKSWTVNGVRNLLRNPTTKTVQISVDPGFTKVFNDGTSTTTFTYTCSLLADWSETGKRKLSGTWSMTPSTGTPVSGAIAPTTPLTWVKGSGCCHPLSGTLVLTKGTQSATLVFGTPCGTVTVDGTPKQLGPCM